MKTDAIKTQTERSCSTEPEPEPEPRYHKNTLHFNDLLPRTAFPLMSSNAFAHNYREKQCNTMSAYRAKEKLHTGAER